MRTNLRKALVFRRYVGSNRTRSEIMPGQSKLCSGAGATLNKGILTKDNKRHRIVVFVATHFIRQLEQLRERLDFKFGHEAGAILPRRESSASRKRKASLPPNFQKGS